MTIIRTLSLLLILLPLSVKASYSCEAIFAEFTNAYNYYVVPETKKFELSNLFSRYSIRKNSSKEIDYSISQNRQVKRVNRNFDVRFKQDQGKVSTISTYGPPYLVEGKLVIDFKINSRMWDDLTDYSTPVLRRMPYKDFENLILSDDEGYREFRINDPESVFILPNNNKNGQRSNSVFSAYKVKVKLQGSKAIYELVDFNGKTRRVTANELLFWDTHIGKYENFLVKSFFETGGVGDLVWQHNLNPEEDGFYILLKKLPNISASEYETVSWLKDLDVRNDINELLSKSIPVLLVDDNHGILGAVDSPLSRPMKFLKNRANLNTDYPAIIIGPRADHFTLRHEFVHWYDQVNQALKPAIEKLMDLVMNKALSKEQGVLIYTFISEQRAYSTEIELIIKAGNANYAKIKKNYFLINYSMSVEQILSQLKVKDSVGYLNVKSILKEFSEINGELRLSELFSEHF